jgi:Ni/Co efflux regulator RcnB
MSNTRPTPEMLLLEFLLVTREQMTFHTTVMQTFSATIQNSTNTIRSLMQRYLEIQERNRDDNNDREPERNNQNHIVSNRREPLGVRLEQARERRERMNRWPPSTTYSRDYRQSPISTPTLRRRRVRTPNRSRPRPRARRDILTQILENTLYTSSSRVPASTIDISRNVSTHIWRDISDTTDQTLCPITQEDFQSTDNVARIDYCGHVFHDDALRTYLTEFDHRCPICRYNIRTTYPTDPVYMNATTSTDIPAVATTPDAAPLPDYNIPTFRDLSNNTPRSLARTDSNVFDMSFNFSGTTLPLTSNLTSNLTRSQGFEFNFDPTNFDTAINQLSNAMLSSLTTAINNPDNSGNTIAAEYSVFIPQPVTRDESTSTQDDDTETY